MYLKITHMKLQPHLSQADELKFISSPKVLEIEFSTKPVICA